jgi:ankyrin repeat protein
MKSLLLLAASAGLLSAQITSLQMLHRAERAGDLKTDESLLSAGLSPDPTSLEMAMTSGEPRLVDLLLAWHADPNARTNAANPHSLTPLQKAAEKGDLHVVTALVAAGARVNDTGGAGRTPIHYALPGHLDMMRLLIEKGADVNLRDSEGASPLDDAVWNGNLDAAAVLIAHGARLNEPDTQTGATPVNEAAFRGHTELIRYLLLFHPDLTTADNRGRTPLGNAIRMRKEEAALLLLEAQPAPQRTPQFLGETMQAAIGMDQAFVAEALLRQGAKVNEALPSGYIPLDAAAFAGASKAARMLLDNGADPNAAGKDGTTPLEDAATKGFDSIAAALIDHGARVGTTALYAAASSGHLTTAKLLLDRGANPSACGANRKTPFQIAVENDHADVAAEIRSRGGADRCH